MRRPSISLYLMAGFLVLVALPIGLFGIREASTLQAEANRTADRELRFAAESVSRSIQDFVRLNIQLVETLALQAEAEDKPLKSADWMQRTVSATRKVHSETGALIFADAKGLTVASDPLVNEAGKSMLGTDYSERFWFKEMMRTQKVAVGKVATSKVSHTASVGIGAPVHDKSGAIVGSAIMSFRMVQLSRIVAELARTLPDASLIALDGDGRVLLSSEAGYAETAGVMDALPLYRAPEDRISLRTGPDEHGVPMRIAIITLPESGLDWRVGVMRREASIERQVDEVRRGWVSAATYAAGGGLLFAVLSLFLIVRPMQRLAGLAGAIGSGDLSRTPPSPAWWMPEETVGLLRAMGTMQTELRGSLSMFSSLRENLDTAQQNIEAFASDQHSVVSMQAGQLEDVATFARSMHLASAEAAQDAEAVLNVAARAENARQKGDEALAATFAQMEQIQAQFATVAALTRTLEAQVVNIVAINENVEGIAGRSNILSINAAIEAMRAGEVGRGFVVIAREIRELSDSSQRSREQIKETIRQAQVELRSAAEQSMRGKGQIDLGLSQLRASGESLKQLASTVEESAKAASNVARSVQKQRDSVERIANSVTSLKDALSTLMERGERAGQAAAQMNTLTRQLSQFLSRFRA